MGATKGDDGAAVASESTPSSAKERGNAAFKSGDYEAAVSEYTHALAEYLAGRSVELVTQLAPQRESFELLPTLYSNRSAALEKLGRVEEALADAEAALAVTPDWVKARHRQAQALRGMGRLDEARDAYSLARELEDTADKWVKKQLDELDEQTGRKSAHEKIDAFVAMHGSVVGCPTKLSLSMFEVEDVLGEGNYSTVHKARFLATGEVFAVKSVDKAKAQRMTRRHGNLFNELKMEKRLLYRLAHPNVIRLHQTMQDVSCIYFLQEFATGGELWARMRFGKEALVALRPSLVQFYAAQIVNALDYLRARGVVHRDLKPENLLIQPVPGTDGRLEQLKLIDFGTAYDLHRDDLNGPHFVGTPEYMSPEAIAAKAAPTFALDIWAFGCTLFQLSSGRIPFKASSPYLTFLRTQSLRYTVPRYFSESTRDVVTKILREQPQDRLGAADDYASLRSHAYFAGVDFAALLASPVVPVPSLFELCVAGVARVFTCGEGEGQRAAVSKSRRGLPAWALRAGTFASTPPRVRDAVMGALAQRNLLGLPWVFSLFFSRAEEARFRRQSERGYIGMSEQEEGKFRDAFLCVHLGSLQHVAPEQLEATARRLNALEPRPRLLLLGGTLGDLEVTKEALSALHEDVAVVACFDGREAFDDAFGERYYSLYCGGVLFIIVDSFLLAKLRVESASGDGSGDDPPLTPDEQAAEEQAKWLEAEILQGKLCARHVVVVSHHAWALDGDEGESGGVDDKVLPASIGARFFDRMQDAGVQVVLGGGRSKASTVTRAAQSEVSSRLALTNTPPHADQQLLRVVRVQATDVVTDKYTLAELPAWLALEQDEEELDEEPADVADKQRFSDISSSEDES